MEMTEGNRNVEEATKKGARSKERLQTGASPKESEHGEQESRRATDREVVSEWNSEGVECRNAPERS